ncbi:hypothetical protein NL676_039755 [Syzygium grande]|nr:hypothetical protein NL676_039755 [Syzygium grande]
MTKVVHWLGAGGSDLMVVVAVMLPLQQHAFQGTFLMTEQQHALEELFQHEMTKVVHWLGAGGLDLMVVVAVMVRLQQHAFQRTFLVTEVQNWLGL